MGLNPLGGTHFLVEDALTFVLKLVNHSLDFVTFALLFESLFVFFLEASELSSKFITFFALLGNLLVLVSHLLIVLI
jgi:hypothetical protein